ncbi:RNA polymerase sigma factor [Deminuibacter soli]|uniref:Sigma-70 family RNA polymerase sigma factor n=1 Tax=Deminuibacter soli TaxID=2291815 RepID=A0A3E1NIR3_9BACT|nr:sigma-70 family RNA polymerase sigma factor [Deminuibacter soli]RFM27704.1 sigma-70 family RNA polymerase sigma factor [Deminuibacter soli]
MNKDNTAHLTDQELLNYFYNTRDNQWLGLLLQRYTLLLLGVSMKYLKNEEAAKDAVQQIFLKAITELQKYKVEYIKSWLYMVARNHCLMQLRDKHGKNTYEITDNMPLPADPGNIAEQNEKEQALVLMEAAIGELNKEQGTCVTMFYLQKKSYQQISDTTGYNLMQVKSHIQNGKRNLKLLVEKKMKKQA